MLVIRSAQVHVLVVGTPDDKLETNLPNLRSSMVLTGQSRDFERLVFTCRAATTVLELLFYPHSDWRVSWMAEVTRVRMEWSGAGAERHEHIEGVCTANGTHYTRREVVNGIDRGEDWHTKGSDGSRARIKKLQYCPHGSCLATPYITTAPDHTIVNNLDRLSRC
jgi:hypothetical protein